MIKYDERDRLPVSSIKQYAYCKRRFALMFIECEWASNYKIVEGNITHEKVDNPFFNEKRKDLYYSRSVPVFSDKLNLHGVVDIIEFSGDVGGVCIDTRKGKWSINPIEYKNGRPEKSEADNLQLCALAMCLEEMFGTEIISGEIYYGKLRKRVKISLDSELKRRVGKIVYEINELLGKNCIPAKPAGQNCSLCSLSTICMPAIFDAGTSNNARISSLLRR